LITDKNLPIPDQRLKTTAKEEYLFVHSMQIGDSVSFLFSDGEWFKKYQTVSRKMKRKGWKIIQRKLEDKMIIWRV